MSDSEGGADEEVEMLTSMGFSPERVRVALKSSRGDFDAALTILEGEQDVADGGSRTSGSGIEGAGGVCNKSKDSCSSPASRAERTNIIIVREVGEQEDKRTNINAGSFSSSSPSSSSSSTADTRPLKRHKTGTSAARGGKDDPVKLQRQRAAAIERALVSQIRAAYHQLVHDNANSGVTLQNSMLYESGEQDGGGAGTSLGGLSEELPLCLVADFDSCASPPSPNQEQDGAAGAVAARRRRKDGSENDKSFGLLRALPLLAFSPATFELTKPLLARLPVVGRVKKEAGFSEMIEEDAEDANAVPLNEQEFTIDPISSWTLELASAQKCCASTNDDLLSFKNGEHEQENHHQEEEMNAAGGNIKKYFPRPAVSHQERPRLVVVPDFAPTDLLPGEAQLKTFRKLMSGALAQTSASVKNRSDEICWYPVSLLAGSRETSAASRRPRRSPTSTSFSSSDLRREDEEQQQELCCDGSTSKTTSAGEREQASCSSASSAAPSFGPPPASPAPGEIQLHQAGAVFPDLLAARLAAYATELFPEYELLAPQRVMLARYGPSGTRYGLHRDNEKELRPRHIKGQLRGQGQAQEQAFMNHRAITCICYLGGTTSAENPRFPEEQGGRLRAYCDENPQQFIDVSPDFGTAVFFDSKEVPHEVLPCYGERVALTFWLLALPGGAKSRQEVCG